MLRHPYHLVDVSPWPILASFSLQAFGINFISVLQGTTTFLGGTNINIIGLILSFISIVLVFIQWNRDIIREGQAGYHTNKVVSGLMTGFILFLLSEVLLFGSFFYAYFYSSLNPDVILGAQWPPVGIHKIDPWSIPLLGSCILLGAGFILTLGHHLYLQGNKDLSILYTGLSVQVAGIFIWLQYTEYKYTAFTISDSVYGSVLYITTGLHGIHVIIGVLFLVVSTVRMYMDSFTINHNQGLEASIIYFHLIDLIWLLLFQIYYWYGG